MRYRMLGRGVRTRDAGVPSELCPIQAGQSFRCTSGASSTSGDLAAVEGDPMLAGSTYPARRLIKH
jgi:hypothetical protein